MGRDGVAVRARWTSDQAPVVQRADNFIHWISVIQQIQIVGKSLHNPMIYKKSKSVSIMKCVACKNLAQCVS